MSKLTKYELSTNNVTALMCYSLTEINVEKQKHKNYIVYEYREDGSKFIKEQKHYRMRDRSKYHAIKKHKKYNPRIRKQRRKPRSVESAAAGSVKRTRNIRRESPEAAGNND